MSNNEYNNGLKKGYSRSLHILRQIDKDIKHPDMSDAWSEEYLVYNTKKDFMHEIYGVIKKEMEEHTDDEFSSENRIIRKLK